MAKMAKHDNVTIPKSKIIVGLVIEAPLRKSDVKASVT